MLEPRGLAPEARLFRSVQIGLILAGLTVLMLRGGPQLDDWERTATSLIIDAAVIVFALEYFGRFYLAGVGAASPWRARLAWTVSWGGLLDLVAWLPIPIALAIGVEQEPVFAVVWPLKLFRIAPAFIVVGRVLRHEREPLLSVGLMLVTVLVLAGTAIHLLEGRLQPERYGTVADGVWWAIVTVTTTGYGDSYPVSTGGRVLAGLVMIAGLCILAMLTGILANGFSREIRRRDFLVTRGLVTRIPLFRELRPATAAAMAEMLRLREYDDDDVIFRQGADAQGAYFIVEGEVLEEGHPQRRYRAGQVLGEVALLDNVPRAATARTVRRTTALYLDIADFHNLLSRDPSLVGVLRHGGKRAGPERGK